MLTQTAKYAIKALLHLSQVNGPGYAQARDIAEQTNLPANYLGKTLQKLAHSRVLDSQKGLHGGFRLGRPPEKISLYEILVAIEAIPRDFSDDQTGLEDLPCAICAKFAAMSDMYLRFLKETTLADLAANPATATTRETAAQSTEPA